MKNNLKNNRFHIDPRWEKQRIHPFKLSVNEERQLWLYGSQIIHQEKQMVSSLCPPHLWIGHSIYADMIFSPPPVPPNQWLSTCSHTRQDCTNQKPLLWVSQSHCCFAVSGSSYPIFLHSQSSSQSLDLHHSQQLSAYFSALPPFSVTAISADNSHVLIFLD